MPSELRQTPEYNTMTEALANYLNSEQAPPGTLRKFLGNLTETMGELTGTDRRLPEILSDADRTAQMNQRYMYDRESIPTDSLDEYKQNNAMSMMSALGGIKINPAKKVASEAQYMIEDKLLPRKTGQIGSYHAIEDVQPMKKK